MNTYSPSAGGARSDMFSRRPDVESVKTVAGHELRGELARHGMGVVFLAYHPLLRELRAIKRPQTRDGSVGEHLLARFRREVQAIGALRHDHIIRAHDAGSDADGPYLVMEFLDGEPLNSLLGGRRWLAVPQACELVRQAAIGLQAAHERGLVHRDVKPSNLMLTRANSTARVVVIDWGLVKWIRPGPNDSSPMEELTISLTALGTPDYIAPEQARDAQTVDGRADIYSLGATLYCLLAGKPPFHDRSPAEKISAHTKEKFPSLQQLRSDVSPELAAVLMKMVEKDPARRYRTCGEVAKALQPFCCPESRLLSLLQEDTPLPKPPPLPPTTISPQRRRRIIWGLMGAAGLLLIAVLLALVIFKPGSHDKSEQPGASAVLGDDSDSPVSMKESHPGHCSSLVFMPDGMRAVSESGGGGVYVWDLRNRRLEHSWLHMFQQPFPDASGVVAVSPDGRLIAAAGLNTAPRDMILLSLFDSKTYQRVNKDYPFSRMSRAIAFSPDGSRLATAELRKVLLLPTRGFVVFEVQTWRPKKYPSESLLSSLAFSPDGRFLIGGSEDKSIRLWSLEGGVQKRIFEGHAAAVDEVACSADGRRIFSASSGDGTLRVWNNDNEDKAVGREMKQAAIGRTTVKMACAALWPRGRALTGHADGSVILWDLTTCSELKRFRPTDAPVTAVAISPDGQQALAALADRRVYLCRLPPPRAEP